MTGNRRRHSKIAKPPFLDKFRRTPHPWSLIVLKYIYVVNRVAAHSRPLVISSTRHNTRVLWQENTKQIHWEDSKLHSIRQSKTTRNSNAFRILNVTQLFVFDVIQAYYGAGSSPSFVRKGKSDAEKASVRFFVQRTPFFFMTLSKSLLIAVFQKLGNYQDTHGLGPWKIG